MARSYLCGTVRDSPRSAIYALRVQDELLDLVEIDQLAARMREKLARRGETTADVVVVQGHSKETLALFGVPYSTGRLRDAMFSSAIRWAPIALD